MRDSMDLSETRLGSAEKEALVEYCQALQDAPDLEIRSITLYGSALREDYQPGRSDINLLIVAERIDVPILAGVLDTVSGGQRYGFAPFFLTEEDLRSSADVFPVKFLMIQDSYQVLVGKAPALFGGGKGAGFLSNIATIRKNFQITLESGADTGRYHLKLVPNQSSVDLMSIELEIAKKTYDLLRIVTFNVYGDETRIDLKNVNFDSVPPESKFRFEVPEGFDVVQMNP